MKRTLKNILVLFIMILAACAMLLTMVQIKKGEDLFDWESYAVTLHLESDSSSSDASDTLENRIILYDEDTETDPETSETDTADTADTSTEENHEPAAINDTPDDTTTPPDKPDGDTSGTTSTDTPPAKPDGDTSDTGTTPPDLPGGDMGSMDPSAAGTASTFTLTWKEYLVFGVESFVFSLALIYLLMSVFNKRTFRQTLKNGDKWMIWFLASVLFTGAITYGDVWLTKKYFKPASASSNTMMGTDASMQGGGASGTITYSAATTIDSDTVIDSGDYSSDTANQNAIFVDGVSASISNATVDKTGSSDGGDNTSFYGINSAILADNGAKLTLNNVTVNTDATGANGVFSYGGSATTDNTSTNGTQVNISSSQITTQKDNSGGIMVTGGGSLSASDLVVTTYGNSSAAIRSDRGGGTMRVSGGTYTTYGVGSPAIYSTADIQVENADLISQASEGAIIEGSNSITLANCNLQDSNTELNGNSTTYKNVFIYQSMSGDAAEGKGSFNATGCNITTNNGDSFFVTNTTAYIYLSNNTITNLDPLGSFLRVQKGAWGNEGSNGGNVTMELSGQSVSGSIAVDDISTLDLSIKDASTYEGTINADNTASSLKITLSADSTITLTGDSYISELDDEDETMANINCNGYILYIGGEAHY